MLFSLVLAMATRAHAGDAAKWSLIRNNSGTPFQLTLTDDFIGAITLKEVAKDREAKYPYTNGLGETMTLPHLSVEDPNEKTMQAKEGLYTLAHPTRIKGWDLYWKPICEERGEIATIPAYCTVGIKIKPTATRYNLIMKVWGLVGPNAKKATNTLSTRDVKFINGDTKVVNASDELGVIVVNPNNLGNDDLASGNYFITLKEP